MKPKFILCLALVLSGGLFARLQANAAINVPTVAAPTMQECQEAKINDLGLWDDVFRFKNLDSIILRRGDELFSYSLVTSDLKRIRTISDMTGSRIIDGVAWEKHQWLFCQSDVTLPFAVDLSTGQKVQFPIPQVKLPGTSGPAISAIVVAGSEGGTIIEISDDYFWMNLESGRITKFPTGWDLRYFSADQKRAVFENVSTNSMMYRPWVTVDMTTGKVTAELPDQTKELWSEPTMEFWQASVSKYESSQNVWQLRTPRTPMKLLHPQPGRGFGGDKFAGLSVNGIDYPLVMTNVGTTRCVDAKSAGNLAAFWLQSDGGEGNELWISQLKKEAIPTLLATNCSFEMLGAHRCALIARSEALASWPEAVVYDAESKRAWNILDGVQTGRTQLPDQGVGADKTNRPIYPESISGTGPMVAVKMVPGFGSDRFPTLALCLCSSSHVVPQNMLPPPVVRQIILLTAQGERFQVELPKNVSDLIFGQEFWLHNSGKLVVCQSEPPQNNSPTGQFHLIIAELLKRP